MTSGEIRHLLLFLLLFLVVPTVVISSKSQPKFTPKDNYLIDCGSPEPTKLEDGRIFKSDKQSSSFLSTSEDVKATAVEKVHNKTSSMSSYALLMFPFMDLYMSARIFPDKSTYSFFISEPGRHWVRLYFFPMKNPDYNFTAAVFTVTAEKTVLLRDFSCPTPLPVLKEYLINLKKDRVSLVFTPAPKSIAFINAIEVVSAPGDLIKNTAINVVSPNTHLPNKEFTGMDNHALQLTQRINVGGPLILPSNDPLFRGWQKQDTFLKTRSFARNVSISTKKIKYPGENKINSQLVAPAKVYSTCEKMINANVAAPNFNITWEFPIDGGGFSYLLRLHLCDIISKQLNDLYFNIYVNGLDAAANLDLSTLTSALSTAYYTDLFLGEDFIHSDNIIRVQIGPSDNTETGAKNAILNGVEVFKMSNVAGSLDGLYSIDGLYKGVPPEKKKDETVAWFGLVLSFFAIIVCAVVFYKWRRRPADWHLKGSLSSWLLPIRTPKNTTKLNSSSRTGSNRRYSSRKSKSSNFFSAGTIGIGRFYSFSEVQEATRNFAEKSVIGVGGFGKVYMGNLEDGTKIAVKRGNPSSEQGINEFQTEIQLLSKLRHRHLVSLMGYCDEDTEMILVYEFMSNGPLNDHLYGPGGPNGALSWKRRLEICIGAARGLHYLHTGAAEGIIHRDVKTTNILLDEAYVAKVADFGLSKTGPSMEQTHVSTAVKGSFG